MMKNVLMNKILVVDDELSNLKAVKRILYNAVEFNGDVEIVCVDNGLSALEMVASFHPDIVLLDIMMPGMDGYEVCQEIKSTPESKDIMIMLLSGKTSVEDRLKGYAVKADDYITKPYDPDELLAKIRVLLRLRAALKDLNVHNKNLSSMVVQRTNELLAKEKQAIIGQMVQGIVHNLRGPLTGILGFNQLAQDLVRESLAAGKLIDCDQEERLQKIDGFLGYSRESQKKLEELISNLLVKGRNDSSLVKEALDINQVIVAELKFLEADMIFKHKVKRQVELADGLSLVWGRYSDFSQIFCNLVQNSVDAMIDRPIRILQIRTKEEAGFVRVDFQDTGSGIQPENMKKIFEPFFSTKARQVLNKPKLDKRPKGTGLGLYTCAEIIKTWGGKIMVKSTPDEGSCFSVLIPIGSTELTDSREGGENQDET